MSTDKKIHWDPKVQEEQEKTLNALVRESKKFGEFLFKTSNVVANYENSHSSEPVESDFPPFLNSLPKGISESLRTIGFEECRSLSLLREFSLNRYVLELDLYMRGAVESNEYERWKLIQRKKLGQMEEYQLTIGRIYNKLEPVYETFEGRTVDTHAPYDYDRSPYFQQYDDFSNIAANVINELKWAGLLKDEANFYFTNYEVRDAFGGFQSDGLPLVGISKGLFERLLTFSNQISPELERVLGQLNINVQEVVGEELAVYLFKVARHFSLLHELAHVIQCENKNDDKSLVTENTMSSGSHPFSPRSHMSELDADQFAARRITKIIVSQFDKLEDPMRTPDSLADLLGLALLGIYNLFHILSNEFRADFVLEKGKHPHQVVRIQAAIQTVENTFKLFNPDRYKLNVERMQDLFVKGSVLVTGSTDRFVDLSQGNQKEINDYLDRMMKGTLEIDWMLTTMGIG